MDYTVDIALRANEALTQDSLMDIASIGGVATGNPGGHRVETTLTVTAESRDAAIDRALRILTDRVQARMIEAEAMTTEVGPTGWTVYDGVARLSVFGSAWSASASPSGRSNALD